MKKFFISILFCTLITNPIFANEITDDYVDIARNYLNSNNESKAREYINLVLTLDPHNRKAQSFKLLTIPELEDLNKASTVTISDTVQKTDGDDSSSSLNNEGVNLYNQEKVTDAVHCFKQAIIANKYNVTAYRNLALAHLQLGNPLLAKCYLKLAYNINPAYTTALVTLANMSPNQEKENYLHTAANSNSLEAKYYLAQYYKQKKMYLPAVKYYNAALISEPNLAQAYIELAQCYYYLEDYEPAIINLKNYLTYNSKNDEAHHLLAKAYLHLQYQAQAQREFEKAIKLNRKNEYLFSLAKMNYYEQNYDISLYILNNLLKLEQNPEYYNMLGLAYFEKEELEPALKNFEKALSLDSQSAIIYYNISRCYKLLNNPQKANEALEKAKLIIPHTPTQAVELAMFYYKISDAKNALKTINDATYTFCADKKVYKAKIKLNKLLGNYHEYEKAKVELLMKFGVKTLD